MPRDSQGLSGGWWSATLDRGVDPRYQAWRRVMGDAATTAVPDGSESELPCAGEVSGESQPTVQQVFAVDQDDENHRHRDRVPQQHARPGNERRSATRVAAMAEADDEQDVAERLHAHQPAQQCRGAQAAVRDRGAQEGEEREQHDEGRRFRHVPAGARGVPGGSDQQDGGAEERPARDTGEAGEPTAVRAHVATLQMCLSAVR